MTLYTTSCVISDYTNEPGALGYIGEVDLQSLPPSWLAPPKTGILPCAEELFGGILAAIENLDGIGYASCPCEVAH